MRRLVFDVESDGLLDEITTIWTICVADLDYDQEWSFRPEEIEQALTLLDTADELWLHNGIGFDLPALEKVCRWKPRPGVLIRDTLILAKLCFSDREDKDREDSRYHIQALNGSHSLKAWGVRLGFYKGTYGEQEDAWDQFSEEMLAYCVQDVRLTKKLAKYLERRLPPEDAVDLEHRTATYAEQCNRRGWTFDVEGAEALLITLQGKQDELRKKLVSLFPGTKEVMKKPSYWKLIKPDGSIETRPTKGECDRLRKDLKLKPKECRLEAGPPPVRIHDFNPGSTKQIAAQLYKRYGWTSPELTDKGSELLDAGEASFEELIHQYPQIKEDILETLKFDEAPLLVEYKMLDKRISMLARGDSAWLKLVSSDGRMYYRLNSIGTITQRAAHSRPNLSQVTGVDKPWGEECRALFRATEGYSQVGVDLSGIEARMLAHFLFPYDRGAFADLVLNGDFHQHNADNISLPRKQTKNVFYGWSYGAGDVKIGKMVVAGADDWKSYYDTLFKKLCRNNPPNKASKKAYREIGKIIRGRLEQGINGLPQLIEDVKSVAKKKGHLSPLDGRRIPVRSDHSALNTLLQGSAAIVAKRWLVQSWDTARQEELDSHMLIFSHDEVQSDVRPNHVDRHIEIFLDGIKYTERYYKIKIRLDGEAKVGTDWASCH